MGTGRTLTRESICGIGGFQYISFLISSYFLFYMSPTICSLYFPLYEDLYSAMPLPLKQVPCPWLWDLWVYWLQVDMRDFLNAPNGLPKQSFTGNERVESDPSQSPLVGKMVWKVFKFSYFIPCQTAFWNYWVCYLQDVFDLPFHMARDQIEESLRNKMASIKVITY